MACSKNRMKALALPQGEGRGEGTRLLNAKAPEVEMSSGNRS
jgi:hypothetical protein